MNIIDKKYKVFKNGTGKNLEKNEFVPQRIDKNGYCVLNIIYDIKRRKNWAHISKNYIFKENEIKQSFRATRFTYEQINKICELIASGKTNAEIQQMIFNEKTKSTGDLISGIRNNKKHRIISNMYWKN